MKKEKVVTDLNIFTILIPRIYQTLQYNIIYNKLMLYLYQFSHTVVSHSLQSHGLQHTRLPCPSPTPRACTNSVHRVSDIIQLSHPLSFTSPPASNLSQHQDLFQ